jgi:hypothetical protein
MTSLENTSDVDSNKKASPSVKLGDAASDSTDSLERSLKLLAAEMSLRLHKKAADLHGQVMAKHNVIKHLDELTSTLADRAQTRADGKPNKDGSIDCKDPAIRSLVTTLRAEGVSVPLPEGTLSQAERNSAISALINQRELLSDEEREKGQEFHQCVSEQNSFFQAITSLIGTLHSIVMKMITNMEKRTTA